MDQTSTGATAAPSDEDVQERARKLIGAATPEDREGLAEMQKLMLSIAIVAVKKLLSNAVDCMDLSRTKRKKIKQQIEGISSIEDQGCMQVDFFDRVDNKPATVYVLLETCNQNYNLGPTLDGIKERIPEQKLPELIKVVSSVFNYGRFVYEQVAGAHPTLIREIEAGSGVRPGGLARLNVDSQKTTLYLTESSKMRLGITIRRSDSLIAAAAD